MNYCLMLVFVWNVCVCVCVCEGNLAMLKEVSNTVHMVLINVNNCKTVQQFTLSLHIA
jgi:hypothetical protein